MLWARRLLRRHRKTRRPARRVNDRNRRSHVALLRARRRSRRGRPFVGRRGNLAYRRGPIADAAFTGVRVHMAVLRNGAASTEARRDPRATMTLSPPGVIRAARPGFPGSRGPWLSDVAAAPHGTNGQQFCVSSLINIDPTSYNIVGAQLQSQPHRSIPSCGSGGAAPNARIVRRAAARR